MGISVSQFFGQRIIAIFGLAKATQNFFPFFVSFEKKLEASG